MERKNHQDHKLTLALELTWWLVTALVLLAVLYPVYSEIPDYPFFVSNGVFVLVFLTLARYIFLTKYTFLDRFEYLKIGLTFGSVPLVFLLINELNYFQAFLDEDRLYPFLEGLDPGRKRALEEYIRTEMLFFGTASILTTLAFPFRMIISIWKNRNR